MVFERRFSCRKKGDTQSIFWTAPRFTQPNITSSSHWGGKLRVPIHPLLVENGDRTNIDMLDLL